jgi:hypothetical protein
MPSLEIDTISASDIVYRAITASPAKRITLGKLAIVRDFFRDSFWWPEQRFSQSNIARVKLSAHDGNVFLEGFGRALIGVKSIEKVDVYVFDNQAASIILGPWDVCEMKLCLRNWTEFIEDRLAEHVTKNKSLRKLSLGVHETVSGKSISSVKLLKAFATVGSLLIECELHGFEAFDPVWQAQVQRAIAENRLRRQVIPSLLKVGEESKSSTASDTLSTRASNSTRVLRFLLDLPFVDNSRFFDFLRRNEWDEQDAIQTARRRDAPEAHQVQQ